MLSTTPDEAIAIWLKEDAASFLEDLMIYKDFPIIMRRLLAYVSENTYQRLVQEITPGMAGFITTFMLVHRRAASMEPAQLENLSGRLKEHVLRYVLNSRGASFKISAFVQQMAHLVAQHASCTEDEYLKIMVQSVPGDGIVADRFIPLLEAIGNLLPQTSTHKEAPKSIGIDLNTLVRFFKEGKHAQGPIEQVGGHAGRQLVQWLEVRPGQVISAIRDNLNDAKFVSRLTASLTSEMLAEMFGLLGGVDEDFQLLKGIRWLEEYLVPSKKKALLAIEGDRSINLQNAFVQVFREELLKEVWAAHRAGKSRSLLQRSLLRSMLSLDTSVAALHERLEELVHDSALPAQIQSFFAGLSASILQEDEGFEEQESNNQFFSVDPQQQSLSNLYDALRFGSEKPSSENLHPEPEIEDVTDALQSILDRPEKLLPFLKNITKQKYLLNRLVHASPPDLLQRIVHHLAADLDVFDEQAQMMQEAVTRALGETKGRAWGQTYFEVLLEHLVESKSLEKEENASLEVQRKDVQVEFEQVMQRMVERYPSQIYMSSASFVEKIKAEVKEEMLPVIGYLEAEHKQSNFAQNDNQAGMEPIDSGFEEETPASELPIEEPFYIRNAGMVLLWPFLSRYFAQLDLTEGKDFKDNHAQQRAVYLLQYLVFNEMGAPEYDLLLNKILCGVPSGQPIKRQVDISEDEMNLSESLLLGVTQNWDKLKNTSVQGLQESFIQREGRLTRYEDHWELQVEHKSFDVLLSSLPWSYSTIRLPWMKFTLFVKWR